MDCLDEKLPLDDLYGLCKMLFGIKLYSYQIAILDALFSEHRKVTIRATTRAGKSYAIAIGAILYAMFKPGSRVGIVAPSYPKAKILMNYISDILLTNEAFLKEVEIDMAGKSRLEGLKKEVSRRRITFTNGSSIELHSVDLGKKGIGIMGRGYDCTIVEEVAEISTEAYGKIYRMLLESESAKILEIGNPWNLEVFYEHHNSDDWFKIHITAEDCIREGRVTREAVEDQRRNLTVMEARILLDAEFPLDIEDAIFYQSPHLENAIRVKKIKLSDFESIGIGADIARGGGDLTVLTVIGYLAGEYYYITHKKMDTKNIMNVVGQLCEMYSQYENCTISVDTVGLGAGVFDRLVELKDDSGKPYNAKAFVAGHKSPSERFYNKKTQTVIELANIMKEGRFWNLPDKSPYILELRKWIIEVKSDRQIHVVDPEKSPNYSDSLAISIDAISPSVGVVSSEGIL